MESSDEHQTPDVDNATGGQIEHVDTISAGQVKQQLDDAVEALESTARLAAGHGSEWGDSVAAFCLASVKSVPALPTLADCTEQQRAAAVGSLATVKFASKPGKYLILAVDEESKCATVTQPSTATLLTPQFGTVTVDPAARVFDPTSLP